MSLSDVVQGVEKTPGRQHRESWTLERREVRITRHESVRTDCLGQDDEEVVVGIIGDALVPLRGVVYDLCQLPDRRHEQKSVLGAQVAPELRPVEHRRQLVEEHRRDDEAIPPSPRAKEESGAHALS